MASIPPSNPPSTTADVPQLQHRTRFVNKYTAAERTILEKFREEYLKQDTPQLRTQFFNATIWPPMFFYWTEQHGHLSEQEVQNRSRDLAAWVRNTWRHQPKGTAVNLSIRKSDYLWLYRRDEVWEEIASILGVPMANSMTPNWFPQRTKAIQNLLSKMTQTEKDKLEREIEKIAGTGHTPEIQCRLAEKHCTQRFESSAKSNWLEMGALTLSFVSYTTSTGQLAVELHEIAVDLAGVRMPSFEERHPNKVKEIQRLWLEYVRDIIDKKSGVRHGTNHNPGQSPETEPSNLVLETTEDGYPFLPENLEHEKIPKKAGVNIMRQYLRQHYFLASNRTSDQVPYTEFAKGTAELHKFINKKYLPASFRLIDPHNHKLQDIKQFLEFILKRQKVMPVADVFRFAKVKITRKGDETTNSMYPDEIDKRKAPEPKKKVSKKTLKRNRPSKIRDQNGEPGAAAATLDQAQDGHADFNANIIPEEHGAGSAIPQIKASLIDFEGHQHTFRASCPTPLGANSVAWESNLAEIGVPDVHQKEHNMSTEFRQYQPAVPDVHQQQVGNFERPLAAAATIVGSFDFYRQDVPNSFPNDTFACEAMPQIGNFNPIDSLGQQQANSEFRFAEFEDALPESACPDAVRDLRLPPELSGGLEETHDFGLEGTLGQRTENYGFDWGFPQGQELPNLSLHNVDRHGNDFDQVPRSLVESPSEPRIQSLTQSHAQAIQQSDSGSKGHLDAHHTPSATSSRTMLPQPRPKPIPLGPPSGGPRLPLTHQELYRLANPELNADVTVQKNPSDDANKDVEEGKHKKKRTVRRADDLAIEEAAATAVEGKRIRRPKVRG